jgi:hypothetical protein
MFYIKNKEFSLQTYVVTNLKSPIILGINFLAKYDTVIDFATNTLIIDNAIRFKIEDKWLNNINATIIKKNNKLSVHGSFNSS